MSRARTGAHPVDRLEVALGGPDDRLEVLQMLDDVADHAVREARDVREDAVPAGLTEWSSGFVVAG